MKTIFISGWILFLWLGLLNGCSREDTVKIGVVAPMSGPLAEYGKDIANGAQLAIDEVNAQPNFRIKGKHVRFKLIVEDDRASEEQAKVVAERLIDTEIVAVVGNLNSSASVASAPIYARAGIPQLSLSTSPYYSQLGFETTFRMPADDIQQGQALAQFISSELNVKSIFITDDQTMFGRGLTVEILKVLKDGPLNLIYEPIDPAQINYQNFAAKIKKANVNAIFFGGDENTGAPLIKALRNAGVTSSFIVGDAMCSAAALKVADGAANQNFYCTIPGVPSSWLSSGIAFGNNYEKKFGKHPGTFSPMAYDAIHVLTEAMQRARSTEPLKYRGLLKLKTFTGKIASPIEFDEKGDRKNAPIVFYEAISGQLHERLRPGSTTPYITDTVAPSQFASARPIIIGSKADNEGKLLCAMIRIALEAKSFKVDDHCNTGTTEVVRSALIEGKIDLYPEYTGNAPLLFKDLAYELRLFKNPDKAFIAAAKIDLSRNKIVWLKPAPANNSYAIAIPRKFAVKERINSLSDLANYVNAGKAVKIAVSQEFKERNDGLRFFEQAYGFKLKADQIVSISSGNSLKTESMAARGTDGINAAMAYTTDGQLEALNLVILTDPQNAIKPYQPFISVRHSIIQQYPAIKEIIEPIFETLDTNTLSRLNAEMSISSQSELIIARQYLQQKGFIP